ncbi:MAG: hypothetical protein JXR03_02000 [Cyclobacteriaceae bacterium]
MDLKEENNLEGDQFIVDLDLDRESGSDMPIEREEYYEDDYFRKISDL